MAEESALSARLDVPASQLNPLKPTRPDVNPLWHEIAPDIRNAVRSYISDEDTEKTVAAWPDDRLAQFAGIHKLLEDQMLVMKARSEIKDVSQFLQIMHALVMLEGHVLGWQNEAEKRYRHVIRLRERSMPGTSLGARTNLAHLLATMDCFEEATSLCRHELPAMQEELGYDSPVTLGAARFLINVLMAQGQMHEARRSLRNTLAMVRDMHPVNHPMFEEPDMQTMLEMERGRLPAPRCLCESSRL